MTRGPKFTEGAKQRGEKEGLKHCTKCGHNCKFKTWKKSGGCPNCHGLGPRHAK